MTLPAEVLTAGRHNALRTGIDEADGISYTAQAWAEHPEGWRLIAHRRCIDERRAVSGRFGDDRRPLAILDEPKGREGLDDDRTLGDIIAGAVDGGIAEVDARVDLAAILGPLDDADLATLARRWWLGIPAHGRNTPTEVAHTKALRHAKAQVVANAMRAGKRLAIVAAEPELPACPLTRKELNVVEAAADGLSLAEMGARLHLSPNTVKTHLRRITARVEARNTTHVVAMALRAGWIPMEGTQ